MRRLRLLPLFFLAFLCAVQAQPASSVITVDHGPNAPQQISKPYVILVSLDGFRYDYAKRYHAEHLLALAARGASAPEGMLPAYPSITFPNHYTIITGLYPGHHGIVANSFYDPARKEVYSYHDVKSVADGTWYGGTPLWALAEQQGINTVFETCAVLVKNYNERYSGHFQFIPHIKVTAEQKESELKDHLMELVDTGAVALYVWGVSSDRLMEDGAGAKLGKAVEIAKSTGLPIGVIARV